VLVAPAVEFYEIVLALHILAVVFAFGATFAYPVLLGTVTRADPRALPALYRALHAISGRVIMPGVAAIVVFGVYLASHLHLWHAFFVQWGLGVAIVIGDEHDSLVRRIGGVGALMDLLVVITIYFMVTHTGS
jgi:hypothetical protein